MSLRSSIHELIVRTSTDLPRDVRGALAGLQRGEHGAARLALAAMAASVDMARTHVLPVCQDTGTPTFLVRAPVGADQLILSEAIGEAVTQATREGRLRPCAVDTVSGANSGTNLGEGVPVVHVEQWLSDDVEVRLLLRGGGGDRVSAQYALPADLPRLGRAECDLDGVRKCVLHAVQQAQGHGCPAGVLGVAVGGDRASAWDAAITQLFRPVHDVNPDPRLAALEAEILREANGLGIGAQGLGGGATLMGCKVAALHRLPSTFLVTVAYNCWALRRNGVRLDGRTGAIREWLYTDQAPAPEMADDLRLSGREIRLATPLSDAQVRELRLGDVVLLDGVIHTGREAVHRRLVESPPPVDLHGGVLYHCGPSVVPRDDGRWLVTGAGPAASLPLEPWIGDVVRMHGLRAIVGKGGVGAATAWTMRDAGAVYLSAIGGAAPFYAGCVEAVEGVDLLALGVSDAMWHLRVRAFPAVVTVDAEGRSLHDEVADHSARALGHLRVPGGRATDRDAIG